MTRDSLTAEAMEPSSVRDDRGVRDLLRRHDLAMLGASLDEGPVLQLLAGNALFAQRHRNVLATDRFDAEGVLQARVHIACDPEDLPFPSEVFSSVVGRNVLSRCPRPARALVEAERVLVPGGRLLLVEPWVGLLGGLFYRWVARRRCTVRLDPWFDACPDALRDEGNAASATVCLFRRARELGKWVPSLRVLRIEPFGGLSDLLAGREGARPVEESKRKRLLGLLAAEDRLPHLLRRGIGTRALFVIEKLPVSE